MLEAVGDQHWRSVGGFDKLLERFQRPTRGPGAGVEGEQDLVAEPVDQAA